MQYTQENEFYGIPYKLRDAFITLKELKSLKGRNDVTYMAIDIEKHFYPHPSTGQKPILEVGLAVWDGGSSSNQKIVGETYHYVINEYKKMHNKVIKGGLYNHKNDFLGKSSTHISIRRIANELNFWISEYEKKGELVIILHGGRDDLIDLARLGCNINHLKVLDTQLIDRAVSWNQTGVW